MQWQVIERFKELVALRPVNQPLQYGNVRIIDTASLILLHGNVGAWRPGGEATVISKLRNGPEVHDILHLDSTVVDSLAINNLTITGK